MDRINLRRLRNKKWSIKAKSVPWDSEISVCEKASESVTNQWDGSNFAPLGKPVSKTWSSDDNTKIASYKHCASTLICS